MTALPVAQAQDPLSSARAQLRTVLYTSDLEPGTALATTHRHLRQMVNCLEGPQGRNFTAGAGYPCRRQGSGILVDLRAVADTGHAKAGKAFRYSQAAHVFALQGLRSGDADEARTYAWMAAFDIGNALEALE